MTPAREEAQRLEVRRTHDLVALAQALIDSGQTLPASMDQFRPQLPGY